MPELPEAEASRSAVARACLNRTITEVALGEDTDHVDLPDASARRSLEGHQFTRTRRHGKLILAGSKTGPWLAVHLGMTGRLIPFESGEETPDYTKLVVAFEGDGRLAFRNPRKFGWVRIIDDPDALIEELDLGPDALEISEDAFSERIGGRGALKPALLSQDKIAGIGNLWSDEILFQAGYSPEAKGSDLDANALAELHGKMREILRAVVDTGAHYSELPDDWLIHNREEGAPCPKCDGTIAKKTVGGRTAYFCGSHQG